MPYCLPLALQVKDELTALAANNELIVPSEKWKNLMETLEKSSKKS